MFQLLAGLLQFFYSLVPDYASAIALLTLAVMAVLFPLTLKSTRSMLAMQKLQPEIKRLQQLHKGDRQKLSEAQMALFKEHGVNPAAGCLPMLLQLPVFLVMYQVVNGLAKTVVVAATLSAPAGATTAALEGATVEPVDAQSGYTITGGRLKDGRITDATLKNAEVKVDERTVGVIKKATIENGRIKEADVVTGERAVGTLTDIRVTGGRVEGRPKYVDHSSDIYRDLRDSDGEMKSFGIDLSESAAKGHGSFGTALPYFVIVALVVFIQYYQSRQMFSRNPQAAQNPQTKMMTQVMPVFFGFISLSIAAGVNVYFMVSGLFRIAQQSAMYKWDPAVAAHAKTAAREVEAKAVELKAKEKGPAPKPAITGPASRDGQRNRSKKKKRAKRR